MATSGLRLTGNWNNFLRALDPKAFEQRLRREVRRATQRNALIVQRAIRKRIQEGDYAANSPLTLAIKAPKSKPLVVSGGLFQAITQELASDFVAFVGLKFGAKGKDRQDLVNVGLALHEGFTLKVTPAMRRAVFAKMRANRSKAKEQHLAKIPGARVESGPATRGGDGRFVKGAKIRVEGQGAETWVIPSRPFVRQVIEDPEIQQQLRTNWEKAVGEALLHF